MLKNLFIPPALLLLGLIIMTLLCVLTPVLNKIPFPINLTGIILAISGFTIMSKTRMLFKRYKTTLYIEKSSHFITEGVFTWTRNPMYIGMFLILLGIAICTTNLCSLLIPMGFLLIIRFHFIPKEEKMMEEAFGQEYLDYKYSVPRWV